MGKVIVGLVLVLGIASCATPPPPAKPAPEPPAPIAQVPLPADAHEFKVTAEKKQSALAEITVLVDKLNGLIARRSFSEWKTYLDRDYIETFSDPARLADYTAKSPILKQMGVRLKTLEDYFKFVVVPSRADGNDKVDDITFLDENRVNVWTVVDNERVLLYLLKLYGKEWKISSW